MTTLAIVGIVVGYLLTGMIIARILYRFGWNDEDDAPLLILLVIMWAVALPFVILGLLGWGMFKVITMPTRPERIRVKIERSQARIVELERELDIR